MWYIPTYARPNKSPEVAEGMYLGDEEVAL